MAHYETVAASQSAQVMGASGAKGDRLDHLVVVPSSVSPGAISINDGGNEVSITVFAGGTDSLLTLHPFVIPLGLTSNSGGWRVTTGANLSLIAVGNFT